jgi:hypothetical protein
MDNWSRCIEYLTNGNDHLLDVYLTVDQLKKKPSENEINFDGLSEGELLKRYYLFLKGKYKTNRIASQMANINESTFRFRLKKYGINSKEIVD